MKNRWSVLFLATWIQTTASVITQGIGPLSAYWSEVDHLSPLTTAFLVSSVNIGPVFSMMLFGKAIDNYGERWLLGTGSLLLGGTIGLTITINSNLLFLCFLLILVGLWYGVSQPGGSRAIVSWFPSKTRGIAMGIRQTGIPLGGAIAACFIPWLSLKYGVHAAISAEALLAIITGIIFLLIYRENDAGAPQTSTKVKASITWLSICKNRTLYPVFFVGITLVSLQFIIIAHYMTFLINQLSISLTAAGLYLAIVQVFGMIGRVVLAWISDQFFDGNRLRLLTFCIGMTVCTLFFLSFVNPHASGWMITLTSLSLGFFGIGWYSLYMAHISEHAPQDHVAYTVSIGLTLNQIAIVTAPILFGFIAGFQRSYFLAWILLAVCIALAGLMLFWIPEMKVRQKP